MQLRLCAVVLGVLTFILAASPAYATRHRRPFNGTYRITANYDNNGSASGCLDYGCRSRCYNTHTGTDYGMAVGTAVVASASGTVVARNDGCNDYGYYGNTCGGRCGNYVRIRHDDGTATIYCHMKRGSLAVSNGQRVSCGQRLGSSASSGSSTGPHLHHGWIPSSSQDPYVGSCGRRGSAVWVQQNGYNDLPSTTCESTCDCSPGQRQSRACGRCGSQSRTCGSNCKWGGWSGCGGQGVCDAGARQSRGCGRCGSQSRTCSSSCNWGGWGGCGGQGPCAPGTRDSRACGKCGSQTRLCQSSCDWGGWGSCGGQGECSAGATQSEACCDCGTRSRQCSSACRWEGWGACGGPDPSPAQKCDTSKPGVCADGTQRCVAGCLACVENTPASEELCDGLDNNCDGEVDDGAPEQLGEVAPAYAARVVERALPRALAPGEQVTAWLRVENVGTKAWQPGEVVIRALAEDPNAATALSTASWLAHDIPARLEHVIEPGDAATFTFELTAAPDAFEGATVQLVASVLGSGPILCPAPDVSIDVITLRVITPPGARPDAGDEDSATAQGRVSGEGSVCALSGPARHAPTPLTPLALLLAAGLWGRTRRPRHRAQGGVR